MQLARSLSFRPPQLVRTLSFRPIKPERPASNSGVLRVRIVRAESSLSADTEATSPSVKISVGNEEEISFGADLLFRFTHFLGLLSSRQLKAHVWSEGDSLGSGLLPLKPHLSELESGESVEVTIDLEGGQLMVSLTWTFDAVAELPEPAPLPPPTSAAIPKSLSYGSKLRGGTLRVHVSRAVGLQANRVYPHHMGANLPSAIEQGGVASPQLLSPLGSLTARHTPGANELTPRRVAMLPNVLIRASIAGMDEDTPVVASDLSPIYDCDLSFHFDDFKHVLAARKLHIGALDDAGGGRHDSLGGGYVGLKRIAGALAARETVECAVVLDDNMVAAGQVVLTLHWEPDPLNMVGRPGRVHLAMSWEPSSGVYVEPPTGEGMEPDASLQTPGKASTAQADSAAATAPAAAAAAAAGPASPNEPTGGQAADAESPGTLGSLGSLFGSANAGDVAKFDPLEAMEAMEAADRSGVLRIHVSHAVGLKAADLNGKSDPYIKVHLNGEAQQTKVVKRTLHPRFKADLRFQVADLAALAEESVNVEAFDYDMIGAHDLLGRASVQLHTHLAALLVGQRVEWTPYLEEPRKRPGTLKVRVVRAKGLMAADSNGLSDPYVKVTVGTKAKKTRTVKKTVNPTFDEELCFHFDDLPKLLRHETIGVQAWDWDRVGKNESLGAARVALAELVEGGLEGGERVEYKAELDDKQTKPGLVSLVFVWEADPGPRDPVISDRSGIVKVFVSHAVGLRAADSNGTSDPYVKMSIGGRDEKTEVVRKSLNPRFQQELVYRFDDFEEALRETLHAEVWDWDLVGFNDSLGKASVDLADYAEQLRYQARWGGGERIEWAPKLIDKAAKEGVRGGTLKVKVVSARGLKAADRNGLSDPYVKVAIGSKAQKTDVVHETLDPTFDATLEFHFDDISQLIGCHTVHVQAWDWDKIGRNDSLGKGQIPLEHLQQVLGFGEKVDCSVSLKDKQEAPGQVQIELTWRPDRQSQLFVDFGWEPDHVRPPTPPPPAWTPPDAPPKPWLMIIIALGVPCFTGYLSIEAGHTPVGNATAFIMPFIGIYAFLLTPMTPPEDPDEPKAFDFGAVWETYVTPFIAKITPKCVTDVQEWFGAQKDAVVGFLMGILGALLAPFAAQIAKGIQVGMGGSAIAEVLVAFKDIPNWATGVVISMTTTIQLPDSLGFLIAGNYYYNKVITSYNDNKGSTEESVVKGASVVIKRFEEMADQIKEEFDMMDDGVDILQTYGLTFLKPYLRMLTMWLDEIGEIARANPFKLIVIIFDLVVMVDEMQNIEIPEYPEWATWDSLQENFHSMFDEHVPPKPPAWAVSALSFSGATNKTGCGDAHEACQALGTVFATSCSTTKAWFPHSIADAHQGLTLFYNHTAIVYELVIFYQLAGRQRNTSRAGHGIGHGMEDEPFFHLQVEVDNEILVGNDTFVNASRYDVDVSFPFNASRIINVTQLPAFKIYHPPSPPPALGWGHHTVEGESSPFPLFENRHLHDTVSLCPHPLRLRLRGDNESLLSTRRVHVSIDKAEGAVFGIDAAIIREDDDDLHGNDGAGHHGFEEAMPEFELPPLEEILTFITMCLTIASSSEFVRSHVDPEGYAAAKAKESYKKSKHLAESGALIKIKKIIATPLLELDIAKAMAVIEEAEKENVLDSLIDKATEHTEHAIEAYMNE